MRLEKNSKIVILLVSIIVILIGVVVYFFVIRTAIQNMQNQAIQQGVQYAIYSIMQESVKCTQVPLTLGNQTINMIAVECLKQ